MYNNCTVGHYWKEKFGEKVYRISIDGGFTCPTRDGSKGYGGCYFCDEKGSTIRRKDSSYNIEEQIKNGMSRLRKKGINKFIAYFQSYTNTYAPVDILRERYLSAFVNEDIVGISVSTRPDCINEENVDLLNEISDEHYTIVELGIQTVHQHSLDLLGRKHSVLDSKKAIKLLNKEGNIEVVAHVILGLPGETKQDMIDTAKIVSEWGIDGIKLHHLYIVKNTPFAREFKKGNIELFEEAEDYAEVAREFLENLPNDIIIHRFSGYAIGERLIAPYWTCNRHIARDLILKGVKI
jgi:radical SAM protein (TIGR01212 family)